MSKSRGNVVIRGRPSRHRRRRDPLVPAHGQRALGAQALRSRWARRSRRTARSIRWSTRTVLRDVRRTWRSGHRSEGSAARAARYSGPLGASAAGRSWSATCGGSGRLRAHARARRLGDFMVDDLSNWYVRRQPRPLLRERDEPTRARRSARSATCCVTVARLLAPITPFRPTGCTARSPVKVCTWRASRNRDAVIDRPLGTRWTRCARSCRSAVRRATT